MGDVEFFLKLSLEECKTKCDEDSYCNYFSHNMETFTCKTFHEMARKKGPNHKKPGLNEEIVPRVRRQTDDVIDKNEKTKDLLCKRSMLILVLIGF